jgi:hypothetical protein
MCLGSVSPTATISFNGPRILLSRRPFSRWPQTFLGRWASQPSPTPTPLAVGRSSTVWASDTLEGLRPRKALTRAGYAIILSNRPFSAPAFAAKNLKNLLPLRRWMSDPSGCTKTKNSKNGPKSMKTKCHPTRLGHHILSRRSRTEEDSCRLKVRPRGLAVPEQPSGRSEGGLPLLGERASLPSEVLLTKEGVRAKLLFLVFSNSCHGLSRFVTVCPALFLTMSHTPIRNPHPTVYVSRFTFLNFSILRLQRPSPYPWYQSKSKIIKDNQR